MRANVQPRLSGATSLNPQDSQGEMTGSDLIPMGTRKGEGEIKEFLN